MFHQFRILNYYDWSKDDFDAKKEKCQSFNESKNFLNHDWEFRMGEKK